MECTIKLNDTCEEGIFHETLRDIALLPLLTNIFLPVFCNFNRERTGWFMLRDVSFWINVKCQFFEFVCVVFNLVNVRSLRAEGAAVTWRRSTRETWSDEICTYKRLVEHTIWGLALRRRFCLAFDGACAKEAWLFDFAVLFFVAVALNVRPDVVLRTAERIEVLTGATWWTYRRKVTCLLFESTLVVFEIFFNPLNICSIVPAAICSVSLKSYTDFAACCTPYCTLEYIEQMKRIVIKDNKLTQQSWASVDWGAQNTCAWGQLLHQKTTCGLDLNQNISCRPAIFGPIRELDLNKRTEQTYGPFGLVGLPVMGKSKVPSQRRRCRTWLAS